MQTEFVLIAVFDDVPHDRDEGTLVQKAFNSKQLQRHEVSLARLNYTTESTFNSEVVDKKSAGIVGVVFASASALRAVPYVVPSQPVVIGRGVCLTDKVQADDHDGHAALGWSESQEAHGETQRGRYRELVKKNLTQVFGRIVDVKSAPWRVESNDEVEVASND